MIFGNLTYKEMFKKPYWVVNICLESYFGNDDGVKTVKPATSELFIRLFFSTIITKLITY